MVGTLHVNSVVVGNTSNNHDGYGRLRVSHAISLLSVNHTQASLFDKYSRFFNETLTGDALSLAHVDGYISMIVSTNGDRALRQSRMYIPAALSGSTTIYISGILEMSGGKLNSLSRIGFYDEESDKSVGEIRGDGYYFELDGILLYVVRRYTTNGVQMVDRVVQSLWNVDTLLTMDISKTTTYVIDINGTGAGAVKFGILQDNKITIAHVFNNDTLTSPHLSRTSLPLRYELISNGGVSGGGEMRIMSVDVQRHGAHMKGMKNIAVSEDRQVKTNEIRCVMAFRLKDTNNRCCVLLKNISIVAEVGGDAILWYLCKNPTISNSRSYTSQQLSSLEVELNSNDKVTDIGEVLTTGVVQIAGKSLLDVDELQNHAITASISGTPDIYCICAKNLSSGTARVSVILETEELQ